MGGPHGGGGGVLPSATDGLCPVVSGPSKDPQPRTVKQVLGIPSKNEQLHRSTSKITTVALDHIQ